MNVYFWRSLCPFRLWFVCCGLLRAHTYVIPSNLPICEQEANRYRNRLWDGEWVGDNWKDISGTAMKSFMCRSLFTMLIAKQLALSRIWPEISRLVTSSQRVIPLTATRRGSYSISVHLSNRVGWSEAPMKGTVKLWVVFKPDPPFTRAVFSFSFSQALQSRMRLWNLWIARFHVSKSSSKQNIFSISAHRGDSVETGYRVDADQGMTLDLIPVLKNAPGIQDP